MLQCTANVADGSLADKRCPLKNIGLAALVRKRTWHSQATMLASPPSPSANTPSLKSGSTAHVAAANVHGEKYQHDRSISNTSRPRSRVSRRHAYPCLVRSLAANEFATNLRCVACGNRVSLACCPLGCTFLILDKRPLSKTT